MQKAALHNLGCKVNGYETDAMQQILEDAGYEIVDFSEKADVYIINTCTVTNMADRKSRQMLHRARKQNPDAIVVAAGCYAQESAEELKRETGVDILLGNNQKGGLLQAIRQFEQERTQVVCVTDISGSTEYEQLSVVKTAEHTRAYIKVQDGCNQFCSYCIIPYARGRVRSRSAEDIIKETENLAEAGYREVVLTGIHISSYGIDFMEEKENLLSLLRKLHEVEGIERIRLSSLEPRIVTEEFVKGIVELPKICPHFHLSLQSGCNTVLKRMNRHYTAEEYAAGVNLLRRYYEHPAITTDIIVGFPQETEEEFEQTAAFTDEIAFYETHIFKYSMREGTRAAAMEGQISEQIKTQRSKVLLDKNKLHMESFSSNYIDKEVDILIEETVEISGKQYQVGHTKEYVMVAVEAEENLRNQIITVVIKDFLTEKIMKSEITRCHF